MVRPTSFAIDQQTYYVSDANLEINWSESDSFVITEPLMTDCGPIETQAIYDCETCTVLASDIFNQDLGVLKVTVSTTDSSRVGPWELW